MNKREKLENKWIYTFGNKQAEGNKDGIALLGSKGANLAEMARLGFPVPPGFTLTTDLCKAFFQNNYQLPKHIWPQIEMALTELETRTGKSYGCPENPLLLSVRSGAPRSMPGMMDTILNLGLNDETAKGLAIKTGNPRFAYDSYCRFIQMYSEVVLDIDHYIFEDILDDYKMEIGIEETEDLSADAFQNLLEKYKHCVLEESGAAFPTNVFDQLRRAIRAVFSSWDNRRAKTFRALHDIPNDLGTACTIQSMVFGNLGQTSATGVMFTRDPSTGTPDVYGEYLLNAQGEDVVSGMRTPQPLSIKGKEILGETVPVLEELMPKLYKQLISLARKLEKAYGDMQDIEFTIENGTLYLLQTRRGKRATTAGIKIAVDLANEKIITKNNALMMVSPASLNHLLHPTLDPKAHRPLIGRGLPASPGAATGQIVFSAEKAERLKLKNIPAILVRIETNPEDVLGMAASQGILTTRGGMTSHAAVVARGMGKPCVCGAGNLRIDYNSKKLIGPDIMLSEGDLVTIDGASGDVLKGSVATIEPQLSTDFHTLMSWCDNVRKLKIRANAETPQDLLKANMFGAEGIGLCRTEHMFFDVERINAMRRMILAQSDEERTKALEEIFPAQRDDFIGLFRLVKDKPITIRLLDPPLHEFLPNDPNEIKALASLMKIDEEVMFERLDILHEYNPMLGNRGCRLAISHPDICKMQVRAMFDALLKVKEQTGDMVPLEIMIPLVCSAEEFLCVRAMIDEMADDYGLKADKKGKRPYQVGSMIELPRAALRAGTIAIKCDFFSFGSNDLTQSTLGLSRDDAAKLLNLYLNKGIFQSDPFQTLDLDGVGVLMKWATDKGRAQAKNLKIGICGEHGGDPASIEFCHNIGLDYVSCSPFRVPIARLSAAQAAIKAKDRKTEQAKTA